MAINITNLILGERLPSIMNWLVANVGPVHLNLSSTRRQWNTDINGVGWQIKSKYVLSQDQQTGSVEVRLNIDDDADRVLFKLTWSEELIDAD